MKSNYILAPKKISLLLKGITTSKMLLEIFEHCLADFDFEVAKKRCEVTKNNLTTFLLPNDTRFIIAFVFSLLCEIDVKQSDFFKLLEKYFSASGYSDSFRRFSDELILPFKNSVVKTAKQLMGFNVEKSDTSVAVKVRKADLPVLDSDSAQKIKSLLNEAKSIILLTKLDSNEKSEILTLYDRFDSALYGTDSFELKYSFFAFKYAALYSKKLDAIVERIEEIMQSI